MSLSKPKQCSLSHLSLSLKPFEEMEHVEVLSRGTSLFIPAPEVRAACRSQCHPSRPPLLLGGPSRFAEGLVSLLTARAAPRRKATAVRTSSRSGVLWSDCKKQQEFIQYFQQGQARRKSVLPELLSADKIRMQKTRVTYLIGPFIAKIKIH